MKLIFSYGSIVFVVQDWLLFYGSLLIIEHFTLWRDVVALKIKEMGLTRGV